MQESQENSGNSDKKIIEYIDTGKTETCPTCKSVCKVLKYSDYRSSTGFYHVVEACRCLITKEERKNEFIYQEFRRELKDKCVAYFPLGQDDADFGNLHFSNFLVREGTENAYNLIVDYSRKIDFYKSKGIGILLTGTYGNGKTRLIKTLLNFQKQWNICIFVDYKDVLDRLQRTYGADRTESYKELFFCLTNCDILAVDEIGRGDKTANRDGIFHDIVETRKNKKRPTLFTMNPEGEANLSGRVTSRLKEICLFEINEGTDFRTEALQLKLSD